MSVQRIPEFHNSNDVLVYARETHLLTKLLQQLQKDFLKVGSKIEFEIENHNERLTQDLKEEIYRLLLERFNDYLSLLYFIDVPENKFTNVDGNDAVEVSGQVAFLILKREFQKIWYKKEYG